MNTTIKTLRFTDVCTEWVCPIPHKLVISEDSYSFNSLCSLTQTVLPVGAHPGAFGAVRKYHRHEGVDLYCQVGTPVSAVESGCVVKIGAFTGILAGSPWWRDTLAVMVEGPSGVVVYGELGGVVVEEGQFVEAGQRIGLVGTVLRKNKGRPQTMLHLELHKTGSRAWIEGTAHEFPGLLLDPTPFLVKSK